MIKLLDLLKEVNKILIPRRAPEERQKNYSIATQKRIEQYVKNGGQGDLYLGNTPITSLPNNLKVGGNLNLSSTPITSLPDNLQVGGNLGLEYTSITSLPDNLKVEGNLYLRSTLIASLPNNLQVGENLYLENTPISKQYSKKQLKQIIPGVKGNIYLL